ncbi:MAG: hypothetical protein ABIE42_07380 [Candidatus Eisenbacteria bacterium]
MRTLHHRATILTAALLTACGVLLAACSNSSGPSESDDPGATSAQEVLADFMQSYNERDVDGLLDCLSADFRFYFTEEDQQHWPQLPPWFYKSDEQQVHENMFGDDWNVGSITLNLVPTSVETIPGGGSGRASGDTVVIRVASDLRVNLLNDITYLATNSQEFRFREVSGSREDDGQTLWEMFAWYDLEDEKGDRIEESGWGAIKSLFLESLSETSRRTSPAEVIDQLEAAYIAMDVESYLDCLSGDFIFYPTDEDVQDPELDIPAEWYRSTEQTIHENMFDEGGYVASIQLTLTNDLTFWDEQDPSDPLDDIYSLTEDVELWVNLLSDVTFLAREPSMYLLRVDPDEVGPYDELMWEIYEWHEFNEWQRGSASERLEHATWGGIKAIFRQAAQPDAR